MSSQSPSAAVEIPAVAASRIRRRLLAWFDRHKRDLPWRWTRDPYRVWLSEIMLQQTQVATVIPYYHRFLRRFPTVEKLAAANLDEVLRLWAGLGYYSRARNLHQAARRVVDEHGGKFPETVEGLMSLPGVGRYTAGAIASIAFDSREPVVDGNVGRVLARLFEIGDDVRSGSGARRAWACAERLLPRSRCGDFNQALMELGATVCLPGAAARCAECPLHCECAAHSSGRVAELPVVAVKAGVKDETHVVAAIQHRGRWLFVRRADAGLWGGLWELPTGVLNGESPRALAGRIAKEAFGAPIEVVREPFCDVTHPLTHRRIRFVGHVCRLISDVRRGAPDVASGLTPAGRGPKSASNRTPASRRTKRKPAARWLRLSEAGRLGISTAMRKVLLALEHRPRTDPAGCPDADVQPHIRQRLRMPGKK